MTGYRTPLGRVRGLGSAKHGVGHFITQRVTGIGPGHPGPVGRRGRRSAWPRADYATDQPLAALAAQRGACSLLVIGVGLFHMQHRHAGRSSRTISTSRRPRSLLILNLFVCWLGAAIGIFSILKVAFGGGAS